MMWDPMLVDQALSQLSACGVNKALWAGNVGVKLTYCQAWALGRRAQELQLVGLAVLLPVGSS